MAIKTHIGIMDRGEKSFHPFLVCALHLRTQNGELPDKHFLQKAPPITGLKVGNQRTYHFKQTIPSGHTSNQSNFYI
jgi:hypothetical protein